LVTLDNGADGIMALDASSAACDGAVGMLSALGRKA
jgi:hypothetical protein